MSTTQRPERRLIPPLVDGQRLDQPTFHERYEAMPPETRAELVGGIVYMPSPMHRDHGLEDHLVTYWLVHYIRFTPGLESAGNVTTILGPDSEVQPDHQVRVPEGGLTQVVAGYIHGPPELVVEVSRTSKSYDLGPKKADYEAAGVPEYVVIELDPDRVRWFVLRDGRFVEKAADADGLYRSEVFPGLWLDPAALFAADLNALAAALDRGLASPEHAAFVARLA